ncbi:MAG: pyridoxamine 5'-phosphate oxidase family protein [Candidatus Dormibacteria bacterium]
MVSWGEFELLVPDLAAAGRRLVYQIPIGLAFLATVRPDGGPRVHPVCPVIGSGGLYVLVVAGPKQRDLDRDGRYALHSETVPPPHEDDGFYVTGSTRAVLDATEELAVRTQVTAERRGVTWPSFLEDRLFELTIDRCLLVLTVPEGRFPKGQTIWKAP